MRPTPENVVALAAVELPRCALSRWVGHSCVRDLGVHTNALFGKLQGHPQQTSPRETAVDPHPCALGLLAVRQPIATSSTRDCQFWAILKPMQNGMHCAALMQRQPIALSNPVLPAPTARATGPNTPIASKTIGEVVLLTMLLYATPPQRNKCAIAGII